MPLLKSPLLNQLFPAVAVQWCLTMLFLLHTPLIISLSSSPLLLFRHLLPSSFLCPYLWTLPPSLILTPACQPFPVPSGECVYTNMYCASLHGLQLILLLLFLYLCLSEYYHRGVKVVNTLAAATWMWFAAPQLVDICVSGLAEALLAPYSKAGLRKMVSCGALRPVPFPPLPSLWGPVRPRYFPSLIDSRDGLLAGGAVSVRKCVKRL